MSGEAFFQQAPKIILCRRTDDGPAPHWETIRPQRRQADCGHEVWMTPKSIAQQTADGWLTLCLQCGMKARERFHAPAVSLEQLAELEGELGRPATAQLVDVFGLHVIDVNNSGGAHADP